MAASTKIRTLRPRRTVDDAITALKHGFLQEYWKTRMGDRVDVGTIYDREELEGVIPALERFRLRKLVGEYTAFRPQPLQPWKGFGWLSWLFAWFTVWFARRRKYVNVNATSSGGGVSILLQSEMALMQAESIDVEWDVLPADKVAFCVTKAIHNNLQGLKNPELGRQYGRFVRGVLIALLWCLPFIGRYGRFPLVFEAVSRKGDTLTSTSKLIYRRWNARCWRALRWSLADSTDVMIHDWQPSRFIRKMRMFDPRATGLRKWRHVSLQPIFFMFLRLLRGRSPRFVLLFRDHIDTDRNRLSQPGPARDAWLYVWFKSQIFKADWFLHHPVGEDKRQFVPWEVPTDMALGLPAISSLLDGHNRPITAEERAQVLAILNQLLVAAGMEPIDPNDVGMLVGLISRFCPAKNKDGGLAIMARVVEIMHYELGIPLKQCPHYIDIGNGSIDDVDGTTVHKEVLEVWAAIDPAIRSRLRVLRAPHLDLIKNLVLELMAVLIHPAWAEGWENGVSDAILHSKPAFVGDNAGPAEQVADGESGRVLPMGTPDYIETWARALVEFFTNPDVRSHMEQRTPYWAQEKNIEFTEGFELTNLLWLCLAQSRNSCFAIGEARKVRDLVLSEVTLAV